MTSPMRAVRRGIERGRRAASAALGVGAFAVAVAVLLSGCSGGAKGAAAASSASATSSPTSSNSTSGRRAAFAKYVTCLQQHGVNVPIPTAQPDNGGSPRPRPSGSFSRQPGGFGEFLGSATADPKFQAARQACASLAPTGFPRAQRTISATTFAAFKSCMSDNGVTITQPDPQTALRSLNRADTKTAAALKICQPILGFGRQPSQSPAASVG